MVGMKVSDSPPQSNLHFHACCGFQARVRACDRSRYRGKVSQFPNWAFVPLQRPSMICVPHEMLFEVP